MSEQTELTELANHLVRTTRLTASEASKVIDEVLSFMNETPDAFIRRRHLALQAQGLANARIFPRIAAELSERRFRAGAYSERQLRRIVYG